MRISSRTCAVPLLSLLFAVGSCAPTPPTTVSTVQDRVATVPQTKVLMENACARVQYHDAAVGETIPMHTHPNYIVYVLKSFRARIRLPDGTERISDRKEGDAYWNEAITHSVENLGTTDIHNLIVELKPRGSCG